MKSIISPTPLVSVVVVTYNSSKTIIETLDSIKDQTYLNIELIVSDDCSSDNTCEIVRNWMDFNNKRFVHSELVSTDYNTGVSGNVNRGIAKSHGKWIKSIAGDDLLIPTAIEEYVKFVTTSSEKVRMCVCDVEPFTTKGEIPDSIVRAYEDFFEKESESYDEQRKRVMTSLTFVGPAYFYSRELYEEIGGFSEKYGNAEEWPFVYKIIMRGNRIFAIDKKLVRYRFQTSSLGNSKIDSGLANKSVFKGMYKHYFDCACKDLIREGRLFTAWHYALMYWNGLIQYHIKNEMVRKNIYRIFMIFSPLFWKQRIR